METMLSNQYKIIDLTHPLHPEIPTWNGSCGFCLEIKKDYDRLFRVQQIKMHAGVGTHMDAPSHRFEKGASIAEIPLEQLIATVALLDVSPKAGADYLFSVEDLEEYEAAHGRIEPHSLAIVFTGWCRFWNNPEAYRNQMHFPAVSREAAELLLKRDIAGLAIDTLSPDCLDAEFPVHKLLLGAGKYIIENIADCSGVPPKGSFAIALPIAAQDATEAPIRIVALVPK